MWWRRKFRKFIIVVWESTSRARGIWEFRVDMIRLSWIMRGEREKKEEAIEGNQVQQQPGGQRYKGTGTSN